MSFISKLSFLQLLSRPPTSEPPSRPADARPLPPAASFVRPPSAERPGSQVKILTTQFTWPFMPLKKLKSLGSL